MSVFWDSVDHDRIGYLPQDYALFPHLSVRTNVAFGLHNPLAAWLHAQSQQIDELLRLVGLEPLAKRKPHNLSGGEKQRVALARALAVQPLLLLLDEPVSALDEQMRDTLCRQIRDLQRRTATTTLHVCHNFAEMLAVADRVGVIQDGRIVQTGTPQEILQRPRNRFVAHFVQAGNILTGRAASADGGLRIACLDGVEFRAARGASVERRGVPGRHRHLGWGTATRGYTWINLPFCGFEIYGRGVSIMSTRSMMLSPARQVPGDVFGTDPLPSLLDGNENFTFVSTLCLIRREL